MNIPNRALLRARVIAWARGEGPRGFQSAPDIARFIEELVGVLRVQRVFERARFEGAQDVMAQDFHPYTAIRELAGGNMEEALWLSFLTTACGALAKPSRWVTVRALYSRLGDGGVWSWHRVSSVPREFRDWMVEHRTAVKTLKFGNHRKYETHDPHKRNSTADVVQSYVRWVRREGQGSEAAIFAKAVDGRSPEDAFDVLYRGIRVKRFGRTAKFDWLCLIGDLGLYPISPGRCYLTGASGPLAGARKLFGRLPLQELELRSGMLAKTLGVPVEAIEDTLCNWQKSRQQPNGWLTASGCGA